jgi:hypothetical protein
MLSEEQIRTGVLQALGCTERQLDRTGILLIGSLSQGLGTELSDVDVVVIDFSTLTEGPPVRQLTHIGQQRCELYITSFAALTTMAHSLAELPGDHVGPIVSQQHTRELELFSRIAFGRAIGGEECCQEVLQLYSRSRARELLVRFHQTVLSSKQWEADVLFKLGLPQIASSALREALNHELKRRASDAGRFALIGDKHLAEVIRAIWPEPSEIDELLALWARRDPITIAEYDALLPGRLRSDARFACPDIEIVRLVSSSVVRHGSRTFLIRPGKEAIVARLASAEGTALNALDPAAQPVARDLFELGLGRVTEAGRVLALSLERGAPAATGLTYLGPAWPRAAAGSLLRLPWDLSQLADLAWEIGISGIFFANRQEDAVGAIRQRRWSQVDACFKSMVTWICWGLLAAKGIDPRRPQPLDDYWVLELVRRTPALREAAKAAEHALATTATDHRSAAEGYARIEALLRTAPRGLWGPIVRSMEDGRVHNEVIVGLGNTWARIARGQGLEPRQLQRDRSEMAEPDSLFNRMQPKLSVDWKRRDDIKAELAAVA